MDKTYTAEKVADEYYQDSSGAVGTVVKALEGMRLAVLVEQHIVGNASERGIRGYLIVGRNLAVKILRLVDDDARRRRRLWRGICLWWRGASCVSDGSRSLLRSCSGRHSRVGLGISHDARDGVVPDC